MTPKDKAEALAQSFCDAQDYFVDADTLKKHCCLVEFFEVARAARELVGGPHRHVEACNCEHCTLLKALAALRRKMPKGVL